MVTLLAPFLWPHLLRPTSGKFTFFTTRFVVRRKMSGVMAAAPTTAAKVVKKMLEPWFQSKGLANADQGLAYFAVSKLGEPPTDGKTNTNPEGLTAEYGKWASAVAARLHAAGLSCKVVDKEAFQKQMLEKLIWISAFMLVGARHPGATVGIVEEEYRSEVSLSLPVSQ